MVDILSLSHLSLSLFDSQSHPHKHTHHHHLFSCSLSPLFIFLIFGKKTNREKFRKFCVCSIEWCQDSKLFNVNVCMCGGLNGSNLSLSPMFIHSFINCLCVWLLISIPIQGRHFFFFFLFTSFISINHKCDDDVMMDKNFLNKISLSSPRHPLRTNHKTTHFLLEKNL